MQQTPQNNPAQNEQGLTEIPFWEWRWRLCNSPGSGDRTLDITLSARGVEPIHAYRLSRSAQSRISLPVRWRAHAWRVAPHPRDFALTDQLHHHEFPGTVRHRPTNECSRYLPGHGAQHWPAP